MYRKLKTFGALPPGIILEFVEPVTRNFCSPLLDTSLRRRISDSVERAEYKFRYFLADHAEFDSLDVKQ